MNGRRLLLKILKRAGLLTVLLLVGILFLILRGERCWSCNAPGQSVSQGKILGCPDCLGTGSSRSFTMAFRSTGSSWDLLPDLRGTIVVSHEQEEILSVDMFYLPFTLWSTVALGAAVMLVVGFSSRPCPLCSGDGRLLIEVTLSSDQTRLSKVCCPACHGSGRATALDRWLAGKGPAE